MMKIAQLIVGDAWSGGQNQVYQLIRQMRDVEHILITVPGSVLGKMVEDIGVPVYYLAPRSGFDTRYIKIIRGILKERQIDLVNVHRSTAHTNILLLKMFFYRNFKLIVTRRVSFKQNVLSRAKYNSRHIDGLIAVSKGVKMVLMENSIPEDKIEVIYSGVDPSRFSSGSRGTLRAELGIPEKATVYCCIANYFKWKGQDVLLEAAKLGQNRLREAHFVFAGHRTADEPFKARVKQLGLEDRVHLLGFREDVGNILSSCDVLVSPSISGEGFAGAIREALFMGLPVIATRIAGNDEMVMDGMTGFLADPDSPHSLLSNMQKLYNAPLQIKELGRNGSKLVREKFSVAKTVADTYEYYKKIVRK
ncbi:glycosyltransferase family 4 protein [bacterium]|nr:glycosyltransferase family 4 protein [bacterium]